MNAINETLVAINSLVSAEFRATEQFDQAATDRDAVLVSLVGAIGYTPGEAASDEHVAEFKAIAEAYADQWVKVSKCDALSAQRAWQRAIKRAGIAKPQTAEAIKKQELRAAKGAADKVNPKGAANPDAPVKGKDVADKVIKLTAMEVHLISLLHAGKFEMAHECIRALADQTAPV